MKAVYCEKLGAPDDLVVREVPEPGAPGEGHVTVAIEARGVAFTDVLMVAGEYQVKPELPFVVGGEGAGRVIAVGEGVTDLRVGDAVLTPGGCIERINVAATRVTRLPVGVSLEAAAAFRGNYATAYYAMQRANLQAGETLLVHGAAGGVGLAAVDIGKLYGATVIATAGSDAKLEVVGQMGADHLSTTRTVFATQ